MNMTYNETKNSASGKSKRDRAEIVQLVHLFENTEKPLSHREFQTKTGISPATLRYWLSRKNEIDASPALIEFFENPVGIAFLHRMVTAAHLVFTKNGTASIHNVSDFLQKAGLSPFIASSYTTQCRVSKQMDELLVFYGEKEGKRLSSQMRFKIITLCEDETFHPEICLVAIEPVSNFIILEKYVVNRKTDTWNAAIAEALNNLPVEVVQVASDEGKSLISHALKGLKAHHSPDCFHVIYEIGKGTCGALVSKVRKAEKDYEKAIEQTRKMEEQKKKFDGADKRPPGRRPHFEKRIQKAQQEEQQAKEKLEETRLNHETVRSAKAEIGENYHPYSLKTGEKQDSQTVCELLTESFDKIHNATNDLSDRCKKRVEKAQRVVKDMVATITFFFIMVEKYLDNMQLSDRDRHLMNDYLLPGHYLKLTAMKERDLDRKAEILEKAKMLLSVVDGLKNSDEAYSDDKIKRLEKAAIECVQFFQRSSSCVEGRNAQLALRHQGIHRLSELHLRALTVVHNYYIKRRDGTTAAERFYGNKPNDLFEFLANNMDYPARPRNSVKLAA